MLVQGAFLLRVVVAEIRPPGLQQPLLKRSLVHYYKKMGWNIQPRTTATTGGRQRQLNPAAVAKNSQSRASESDRHRGKYAERQSARSVPHRLPEVLPTFEQVTLLPPPHKRAKQQRNKRNEQKRAKGVGNESQAHPIIFSNHRATEPPEGLASWPDRTGCRCRAVFLCCG